MTRWWSGLRAEAPHDLPEEPLATGQARAVHGVHPLHPGSSAGQLVGLPTTDLAGHGRLIHLSLDGPRLLRPGDRNDPPARPLHRIAELVIVLQGTLEHRDTLGSRGQMGPSSALLVSAGSGVMSEIGESRTLRRDGGDLEMLTVRWLQPGPAVVPTVRRADQLPRRRQGRSVLVDVLGPGGALTDPGATRVALVSVAAGATVDLAVDDGHAVLIMVRKGTALLGDDLRSVRGPAVAVMTDVGARLTIATHLDEDAGAEVVVVQTMTLETPMVHRDGLVAAADPEGLAEALTQAREVGYGSLPRLDD